MSKTKAAIAIVDDDESVCRAISPLRASTCLAEKETSVRELFGWMIIPMTRLKKEGESGRSRSYHVPFTGNSRRLRLWTDAKLGDS